MGRVFSSTFITLSEVRCMSKALNPELLLLFLVYLFEVLLFLAYGRSRAACYTATGILMLCYIVTCSVLCCLLLMHLGNSHILCTAYVLHTYRSSSTSGMVVRYSEHNRRLFGFLFSRAPLIPAVAEPSKNNVRLRSLRLHDC